MAPIKRKPATRLKTAKHTIQINQGRQEETLEMEDEEEGEELLDSDSERLRNIERVSTKARMCKLETSETTKPE